MKVLAADDQPIILKSIEHKLKSIDFEVITAQNGEEAVKLFRDLGIANNLDFEFKHKEIVDRFGRYPHRNATLGRKSSSDELAFLDEPNSSF